MGQKIIAVCCKVCFTPTPFPVCGESQPQTICLWLEPFGFYRIAPCRSRPDLGHPCPVITSTAASNLAHPFGCVCFSDRPEAKSGLVILGVVRLAWCSGEFRLVHPPFLRLLFYHHYSTAYIYQLKCSPPIYQLHWKNF